MINAPSIEKPKIKNKYNNPAIVKGMKSLNPSGRPKGSRNRISMSLLEEAVALEQAKHKKTIYQHFVYRAYKNDKVLVALMKKLVPDMSYIQAENHNFDGEKIEILPSDLDLKNRIKRFLTQNNHENGAES